MIRWQEKRAERKRESKQSRAKQKEWEWRGVDGGVPINTGAFPSSIESEEGRIGSRDFAMSFRDRSQLHSPKFQESAALLK